MPPVDKSLWYWLNEIHCWHNDEVPSDRNWTEIWMGHGVLIMLYALLASQEQIKRSSRHTWFGIIKGCCRNSLRSKHANKWLSFRLHCSRPFSSSFCWYKRIMSLHDSPRPLANLKELQRMPETKCFRRWSRRNAEISYSPRWQRRLQQRLWEMQILFKMLNLIQFSTRFDTKNHSFTLNYHPNSKWFISN